DDHHVGAAGGEHPVDGTGQQAVPFLLALFRPRSQKVRCPSQVQVGKMEDADQRSAASIPASRALRPVSSRQGSGSVFQEVQLAGFHQAELDDAGACLDEAAQLPALDHDLEIATAPLCTTAT